MKATIMPHLCAYGLGIKDGYEQPYEMTMGMAWDNSQDQNESYDRGANVGQRIGAFAIALREAAKAVRDHIRSKALD